VKADEFHMRTPPLWLCAIILLPLVLLACSIEILLDLTPLSRRLRNRWAEEEVRDYWTGRDPQDPQLEAL
jgi:hypothetical protein